MIRKTASANWQGGLKDGQGKVSTQSGVLDSEDFGFNKRFGDQPGTNPEELIAAAHASCFSMALSMVLGEGGHTAEHLATEAEVSLEKTDEGFTITASHLKLTATVPGATEDEIRTAAETAKKNCPVSRLLKAEISLEVTVG
ncbi:OsmC family protein [Rhodalgimonas zhirmunskyi]|uniref:OsmC family protein n=1 Tax=Rhodalgimonas zhirmunskyi TaxID=2964767 RepID=A0AAJ1X6M4_9RHOB|nr:OsmC family protein [Rhodoalgimonas zhirmunskyi]MDQ2095359.1 OsmC family protein [Rhodoalgimonas zhirmunskyi]